MFSARSSYRLLPRLVHTGRITQQPNPPNPVSHGAEAYFVDDDDTKPNTTVYKVDATSDAAESAYEPPSGPWSPSRAGAGTEEYQTLSEDKPHDVPGAPDIKLRYGGMKRYTEDKDLETSKVGEGTEGTEPWRRKPEERAR